MHVYACACMCLCAPHKYRYLWRPEEGIQSTGTEVTDGCGCCKLNLDLLQEESGLLAMDSALQSSSRNFSK